MPYIENVSEAVARLLQPLGIGVAHKPEATIRRLVMRPKAPLSRGETANVVYRVQCGSCEANYVGETGKRLQTRMSEHARAVRRMDQLSLVAEHCAASGHTFSFHDAEILGRGIDQTARETLEAWHTIPSSINRCTILPAAYQALRVRLNQQNRRQEFKLFTVASKRITSQNTCLGEPMQHTNTFDVITAENTNQQDLRPGMNMDAGEHSLRTNTDDGRLQPDRNGDTGNDSATTDETCTDRCKRGTRNRHAGPGQQTRAMQ
ncbi:unnamed protein product, partial [Schistocephalus solidus]|uniref:GIY-YIG domain-containing protein n=1 Tax=Schistocephalus solidus TaxID=70667 RepID=A0A183SBU0_SCHSO